MKRAEKKNEENRKEGGKRNRKEGNSEENERGGNKSKKKENREKYQWTLKARLRKIWREHRQRKTMLENEDSPERKEREVERWDFSEGGKVEIVPTFEEI